MYACGREYYNTHCVLVEVWVAHPIYWLCVCGSGYEWDIICLWHGVWVLQYPLCACGREHELDITPTHCMPVARINIITSTMCLWTCEQDITCTHCVPMEVWVGHHIYPLYACGRKYEYYITHCVPVEVWAGHNTYPLCTCGGEHKYYNTHCVPVEVWVAHHINPLYACGREYELLHYPLHACGSVSGTSHLFTTVYL